MRYIQSASAKWSLRPRHHGQMITFVTPPALPVFIDTVGREKTGHGIKGGGRGGAKKTCCGLSDAIAARRYLRPDVLHVTLNYRHLADFKTHCTRAITLKFTICRQRKEGQRSKLFKLNRENSCIIDSESNGPRHCFVEIHVQKEATADARNILHMMLRWQDYIWTSEGLFISKDKLPVMLFITSFTARIVFSFFKFL